MAVIYPTRARLTRLDADGRPVGAPVACEVVSIDYTPVDDHPEPVDLRMPEPFTIVWSGRASRALFYLVMGWRMPSPLLARHRRRRHK